MAALVQSFPPQSPAATMLQTRPSSSSGHYQSVNSKHQRGSSAPLNSYNGGQGGTYRGQNLTAPVAPYAFTSTPSLTGVSNPLRQHPTSGPSPQAESAAVDYEDSSSFPPLGSLPDVDTSEAFAGTDVTSMTPAETKETESKPSVEAPSGTSAKVGPNRYRQNQKKQEPASGVSDSSPVAANVNGSTLGSLPVGLSSTTPGSSSTLSHIDPLKRMSKDDSELDDHRNAQQLKRYSRRSIATITNEPHSQTRVQPAPPPPIRTYASVVSTPYAPDRKGHRVATARPTRPASAPRSSSDESIGSSKSATRPDSKRDTSGTASLANPSTNNDLPISKADNKPIAVPPRGSSDAQKRINPSPLSRPFDPSTQPRKDTFASVVASGISRDGPPTARPMDSPAAQQLSALSKKEVKKEAKPSRLRRAFSFGSAAELRKASAENNLNTAAATNRAKLQKDQFKDEDEAREAAIIQQQEASGLGASIYSGQGNFFTGSTDHISISSTASSASLMLRKMGKGVKRTSRSLVGLFRPKSITGVPGPDETVPEPSAPQVSVVTVEAEREKVNVNLDPHEQARGGTGFPKLERNSIDAAAAGKGTDGQTTTSKPEATRTRPTIAGGAKERAEVLAAVKKGILKRHAADSASSSPYQRPNDQRGADGSLPPVPRISDSPHSSAPSTPVEERASRGHRRTDSITNLDGEDYFASVARINGPGKRGSPGTPRSGASRNISFSPRIQFHDTWPSGEYDRRGDIATCNRLTPSLAQAIKEELNTFKMEMEVHESSKIYTHFF